MKKDFIVDIIKAFENSNITKMHIKYKKLEIDLDKNDTVKKDKCEKQIEDDEKWILSPIVGKFCKSDVKVGDKINKGATICTIECMKTFNEIKAEDNYIVEKIDVKENELLECNQKIILVRKVYD